MDEENISGATSKTYELAAADVGKKVKVEVSFTDDGDGAESRPGAALPASGTVGDSNAPTASDGTVTTAEDTAYAFAAADFGFADTDSGDGLSSVRVVTLPGAGSLKLDGAAVTADQAVTAADIAAGDLEFEPAANAHGDPYTTFTFTVSDGLLESASAYTMTVDVTAVNDAATGAPSVTGTVRKGQTLTASKGTIADVDGLTKADDGDAGYAYTYQWVRVDGVDEENISGATSKTYELAAADVGKKVKVEVSFTDDGDGAESRPGAALPASGTVGDSNAPTASDGTVTTAEDTAYAFAAGGFRLCRHRQRGWAFERAGGDASGGGVAEARRGGGDGGPGGDGGGHRGGGPRVRACGERARRSVHDVHLHGERRALGERVGVHDDGGRHRGERRGDGRAVGHGDGAQGPDADGVEGDDRRR